MVFGDNYGWLHRLPFRKDDSGVIQRPVELNLGFLLSGVCRQILTNFVGIL